LRAAIELAEETAAETTEIAARHDLGIALNFQGRNEEAMPLIEASFEAAQRTSDLYLKLRSANNWGATLASHGSDFRRAADVTRVALEEGRRAGSHGYVTWAANNLAGVLRRLGDLDEAAEYEQIALRAAEAIKVPLLRGWSLAGLAEISLWQGDISEARRIWESAGIRFEDEEQQSISELGRLFIELSRVEGRLDEGLEGARQALDLLGGIGPLSEANEFALETVRAMVAAGLHDDAAEVRNMMKAEFDPPRAPDAYRLAADGLLASTVAERVGHLRKAASVFERLELRIAQIRVLIDLADALQEAGEDPTATLEEARAIAAGCGAGLYLDQIEQRAGTTAEG